ncbi:MAG: prephenate dehydratase [Deltaproteobacteria bacterium]|nr:prephenate dehydratase [Deltaproteobacteria bacterium]
MAEGTGKAKGDELQEIRAEIDRSDDEILRLLNHRAKFVARVAELKEEMQVPFYVPSRERQIVDRLSLANSGPFPTESIRAVFQEVFSACLSLEKTVKVAYLGPEGTFSHMAVKRQFGLSARAIPIKTIAAVFEEVERGGADLGVVPVENSTEGMINHTLDSFVDSDLKISAEIMLKISLCLLARAEVDLERVERIYSLPVALAQCRRWLQTHLPRASIVESPSTAEAARAAHGDAHGVAVASEMAAKLYDLHVLKRNIEDLTQNVTRFLVLGRQQAESTGHDKTSVLLTTRDQPGILFKVLGGFAERGLNMTKIESRPSRRRPWEYIFFVDVDGHERDPAVAASLKVVQSQCESMKVLGSYPKAEPV